jgi:hypothetical protein
MFRQYIKFDLGAGFAVASAPTAPGNKDIPTDAPSALSALRRLVDDSVMVLRKNN